MVVIINHIFSNKYGSNEQRKRGTQLKKKWWFLLIMILITAIIIISGQAFDFTKPKEEISKTLGIRTAIYPGDYVLKNQSMNLLIHRSYPIKYAFRQKAVEQHMKVSLLKIRPIQIHVKEKPMKIEEPKKIEKPFIYLTFDDGPNQELDEILNILKDKQAKATFFMIEPQVRQYAVGVKRLVQEGHYPAIHSVTHDKNKLYSSPNQMISEMEQTRKTLLAITGVDSKLVRAPYGSKPFMKDTFRNTLVLHQMKMWDWNIDTMDWKYQRSNPHQILINTINGLESVKNKKGPIVMLMHVTKGTASVLPQVIDYLHSKGYQFPAYDPSHHESLNFWNDTRL
jgi:peptidoglycan/xylan/chitin deacetylase (PgdA/CDA1 family)